MLLLEKIDTILQKNVLLEAVTLSEITVGFEFECYVHMDNERKLKAYAKDNKLKVYGDTSIKPPTGEYVGLEIDLGWDKATPRWAMKVVKLIGGLADAGAKTNDSCGFHAHFGFPSSLTKKEDTRSRVIRALMAYQLHKTGKLKKFLDFKGIAQLSSQYASLGLIEKMAERIEMNFKVKDEPDETDDSVEGLLTQLGYGQEHMAEPAEIMLDIIGRYSGHKYALLNVHDSGTLEWRGLRGVLKDDMDWSKGVIKEYIYKHVMPFARELSKALEDVTTGKALEGMPITLDEVLEAAGTNVNKRLQARELAHELTDRDENPIISKLLDGSGTQPKVLARIIMERPRIATVFSKVSNPEDASIRVPERNTIEFQDATLEGLEYYNFQARVDLRFTNCEIRNSTVVLNAVELANCKIVDSSLAFTGSLPRVPEGFDKNAIIAKLFGPDKQGRVKIDPEKLATVELRNVKFLDEYGKSIEVDHLAGPLDDFIEQYGVPEFHDEAQKVMNPYDMDPGVIMDMMEVDKEIIHMLDDRNFLYDVTARPLPMSLDIEDQLWNFTINVTSDRYKNGAPKYTRCVGVELVRMGLYYEKFHVFDRPMFVGCDIQDSTILIGDSETWLSIFEDSVDETFSSEEEEQIRAAGHSHLQYHLFAQQASWARKLTKDLGDGTFQVTLKIDKEKILGFDKDTSFHGDISFFHRALVEDKGRFVTLRIRWED